MGVMRTLALALLLALALAGCGGDGKTTSTAPQSEFATGVVAITAKNADIGVEVEVARTEEERELGLMNREFLAEDAGMFFVFPGEQSGVGFWMKNTLIPLSVAVADADGRITKILDMEPCTADPCAVYDPGPFVTALEANQGAFEGWGVQIGDRMELQAP
jgi:uncharacterized membrane protein (UPF0127 family)